MRTLVVLLSVMVLIDGCRVYHGLQVEDGKTLILIVGTCAMPSYLYPFKL